jgi:hypothetical protein
LSSHPQQAGQSAAAIIPGLVAPGEFSLDLAERSSVVSTCYR